MTEQTAELEVDARPSTDADQTNGKPPVEGEWLRDGRGRLYVKRPGGGGAVFRRGDETIAEAVQRDAQPRPAGKDRRPRAKSKRPKLPPAPTGVDLKELEKMLTEALQAPAMPCAMYGDEWAANHFTTQGPYLARNLVLASEHNPWLRRKLEAAATGQDGAVAMLAMVGVAGALFGYAVPPVVWWLNLPVPDRARKMFGIPPARIHDTDAQGSAPAAPAETPVAA
jgi:hypothetical protein